MTVLTGTVNSCGDVLVFGRHYWAPELIALRGQEVEIHLDLPDPAHASAWSKGRVRRHCTVALLDYYGFPDPDAARAARDRRAKERASVVRGQIAEFLDVLDQRIERAVDRAIAVKLEARRERFPNVARLLRRARRFLFGKVELADHEPAQGVDHDLEALEAILNRGKTGRVDHSAAPVSDTDEPATRPAAAHRLSEVSE